MNIKTIIIIMILTVLVPGSHGYAQETTAVNEESVARQWTEALLFAIRLDLARPTVHARNLFHLSASMYDAWASYETDIPLVFARFDSPYESCRTAANASLEVRESLSEFQENSAERIQNQKDAIGYAAWALLTHRFQSNIRSLQILQHFRAVANQQALQELPTDAEESMHNIGGLIGNCVIEAGLNDLSNEQNDYANINYQSFNTPLDPTLPGNPGLTDPNRWQTLQLTLFIDQSGNVTDQPEYLGADWGMLQPFAMQSSDRSAIELDGQSVPVWLDPGPPPRLTDDPQTNPVYQFNHLLVALWSAHLDPDSDEIIDISPGSLGNLPPLTEFSDDHAVILEQYRNLAGGMVQDRGHALNPFTSEPYETNEVPLADYTRVLAEFWADGPDSETPPGHWFSIYNSSVAAHPQHDRRLQGLGPEVDSLDYDIVAYLALGGALHDSAIAAWSVKRAYDYARPITAIRYMASLGQSSDSNLPSYHPHGIPLVADRIELINPGDELAGANAENVGKIKAFVWRGPDAINNPATDAAGVGWILLENWWPYQRPTFVTPPFPGYVSGHSTFSRAAAEVLTALTGDEYFPGGMAEFVARRNEFLVFEEGPSMDVTLQWATYRDASDQTSLSRIWGGIHPPADDLPGRKIGEQIGLKAWQRVASMVAPRFPEAFPAVEPFVPGSFVPEPTVPETTNPVGPDQTGGSGGGGCSIAAGNSDSGLLVLLGALLLYRRNKIRATVYTVR